MDLIFWVAVVGDSLSSNRFKTSDSILSSRKVKATIAMDQKAAALYRQFDLAISPSSEMVVMYIQSVQSVVKFSAYSNGGCLHQNLGGESGNSQASRLMPIKESIE